MPQVKSPSVVYSLLFQSEFTKRTKSLLWRAFAFFLVGGVAALSENVGALDLTAQQQIVAALILGEITKYVNNRYGNPK